MWNLLSNDLLYIGTGPWVGTASLHEPVRADLQCQRLLRGVLCERGIRLQSVVRAWGRSTPSRGARVNRGQIQPRRSSCRQWWCAPGFAAGTNLLRESFIRVADRTDLGRLTDSSGRGVDLGRQGVPDFCTLRAVAPPMEGRWAPAQGSVRLQKFPRRAAIPPRSIISCLQKLFVA